MPEEKKWRIWYERFDELGYKIGEGVRRKEYKRYSKACRVAKKQYGRRRDIRYYICDRDPFIERYRQCVCDVCGKTHSVVETPERYLITSSIVINDRYDKKSDDYFYRRYTACSNCMSKIRKLIKSLDERTDT